MWWHCSLQVFVAFSSIYEAEHMMIVGSNLHAPDQQIALLDEETGELRVSLYSVSFACARSATRSGMRNNTECRLRRFRSNGPTVSSAWPAR